MANSDETWYLGADGTVKQAHSYVINQVWFSGPDCTGTAIANAYSAIGGPILLNRDVKGYTAGNYVATSNPNEHKVLSISYSPDHCAAYAPHYPTVGGVTFTADPEGGVTIR